MINVTDIDATTASQGSITLPSKDSLVLNSDDSIFLPFGSSLEISNNIEDIIASLAEDFVVQGK